MAMERSTMRVTIIVVVLVALQLLINALPSSAELDNEYCGVLSDGGWGGCDAGRCCGPDFYCGSGHFFCAPDFCRYYCPRAPGAFNQTDHHHHHHQVLRAADDHHGHQETTTDETRGGGGGEGGEVLARRIGNATLNQYYLDRKVNDFDVVDHNHHHDMTTRVKATNASLSSYSSSLLSCATDNSLYRLPLAARQRYPWAALGVPSSQNTTTTATVCGRCLKVTHVGAGGVRAQVKVRVVHVPNIEGLALDTKTFGRLQGADDRESTYDGDLMVKYQFESC